MKHNLIPFIFIAFFFSGSMSFSQIQIQNKIQSPLVEFGLNDVEAALQERSVTKFKLSVKINENLESQEFSLQTNKDFSLEGGEPIGLMYGLFDLAEQIRLTESLNDIQDKKGSPFIKNRGLKFNIPLDARTPSYDDTGDAALKNINEMWNIDFWHAFFDAMAHNRYNTLTLWNPHPFPSMIKLDEYPDIALDDVYVPSIEPVYEEGVWGDPMNLNKLVANNLRKVRTITIDEKIAYWQEVMAYAKSRGVKLYFITWNINMNSVAPPPERRYFGQKLVLGDGSGKYGINNDQDNEKTIAYVRACVKEFLLTYPDLAGIGVTPSENMEDREDEFDREKWLFEAYGKGIIDAKEEQPNRSIEMIHRVWLSGMDKINRDFRSHYPDTFTMSFKYAKARLYSSANPRWNQEYNELLKKHHLKSWWNLRNDDIFHFRWGDPDYVRDYMRYLPDESLTAGYHMGSDGYVWGRETISKYPKTPRELEVQKHWFNFMLWGRLGYDNEIENAHFAKIIAYKFPEVKADKFLEAWSAASKIVPMVNRFHWRTWDFHFAVEGNMDCRKGFNTVFDFIECPTMAGQGILTIPQYADQMIKEDDISGITPLQIADSLNMFAEKALKLVDQQDLEKLSPDALETLDDIKAFAWLGKYYSTKIKAAVALQFSIQNRSDLATGSAVGFLNEAARCWDKYARIATSNYNTQMLARTRRLDWNALKLEAQRDIELAQKVEGAEWQSLFNGHNLDGWKFVGLENDTAAFNVENGAIKLSTGPKNLIEDAYLVSEKSYSNFVLRAEFKMSNKIKGSSGIYFRSKSDPEQPSVLGPVVDISPGNLWSTGMLWDETPQNKRWLCPNLPLNKALEQNMSNPECIVKTLEDQKTWGPWNRMLIIAQGTHVKVYINDILVSDYCGEGVLNDPLHKRFGVGMEGYFAFQIPKSENVDITFRKIFIAEKNNPAEK